jgi:enterochelin esterase family protein
MPLAQILVPGEGWKKVEGATKPKATGDTPTPGGDAPWKSATVRSADGNTVYVGFSKGTFLHAHALTKDGALDQGHPYAPLRLRTGAKDIAVHGLAADRDGRIYAVTEIGVQVFDPTGRMCGVLTPAAAGVPEALAFEGDQLTLWVGDTKYTRTLRTAGAKQ